MDIVATFDAMRHRALRLGEIVAVFKANGAKWRLADYTTPSDFVQWLIDQGLLKRLPLDTGGKPADVHVWRQASDHEIALAMGPREKTYLGYFVAAAMHDLTVQVPKVIHVCIEQSPKAASDIPITQEMIDTSYAKPPRESRLVATLPSGNRVQIVNAVHSGGIGVVPLAMPGVAPGPLRATDIERTLIDLAIRPHYAGGVFEVLDMYRRAVGRVSANRLRSHLVRLGYRYPYHQVVGFLLENAGADATALAPLASLPQTFDLPLAHGLQRAGYSSRWRVWYPEGFAESA